MRIKSLHIALVTLVLSACNLLPDRDEVVAKVGDKKLSMSELSALIPNYLEGNDSALWADDYIKKWVKRELLLQKAEENLKPELKDVSRELEEYRN